MKVKKILIEIICKNVIMKKDYIEWGNVREQG